MVACFWLTVHVQQSSFHTNWPMWTSPVAPLGPGNPVSPFGPGAPAIIRTHCKMSTIHTRDERECLFSPIPSHSQWFIPIPDLLLIVFWVAEILKVKDTALLSWWVMTVECVTVRQSSSRIWCSTTDGLLLFFWLEMGKCGVLIPSHSHQAIPIPFQFPWN